MSTWTFKNINGQGHLLTFVTQSTFLNVFSLETDWSQILCGASMGWGNENECKWFMSHDQDGRHAQFSLETAWWIEAKFYVEPPWDGGTKIWSNGLYHMTKLATMPIYGKNLNKSSSLEPKGRWPWKLVCSIRHLSTGYYQVRSNDVPGMTLTCFMPRSNLVPYAFVWEKGKIMDIFRNSCSLLYKSW